jgi:prepilin-type processing-associated H-X9-DG protein
MSPEFGETPSSKPRRGKRSSLLDLFLAALLGLLIAILLLLFLIGRPPHRSSPRVTCMTNLRALYAAFSLYAEGNGGVYPASQAWCDLLVGRQWSEKYFRCQKGKGSQCDYAMNPNARPRGAPDVVLLFESRSGWNQSGGPELLTTERHEGCNIAFVDGSVRFIKPDEIAGLNWTDEGSLDPNSLGKLRDRHNVKMHESVEELDGR